MGKETILEYNGIRLNIKDWAERTGINRSTISARLYQGWTVAQVLGYKLPPQRKRKIRKITQKEKQQVIELYETGTKVVDISRTVEIAEQSIYKILRENGIKERRYVKSGEERKLQKPKTNQLCWDCGKYAGGCSWSRDFTPVEGWTAEKVLMTSGTETYEIKECPEFVSDLWRYER